MQQRGSRAFAQPHFNARDTLSAQAEKMIRRSMVADEIGKELKADIKKNPWKITPLMLTFVSTFSALMLATLAIKSMQKDFRDKFREAAERPITLKLYEDVLVRNTETGQLDVDVGALRKRHSRAVWVHSHYLVERVFNQLPQNKASRFMKRRHEKFSRYPTPTLYEKAERVLTHFVADSAGRTFKNAAGRQWAGRVFLMASLTHMEPAEIASHLHGGEQALFTEEYAPLNA